VPFAQSGPKSWQHVDGRQLASVTPQPISPATVSDVQRSVSKISFHVDELGKPVEVKESYFPNWKVKGAKGPYRLAPNMMVVIPTSHDVTLTYGLAPVDYVGYVVSALGLIGLVLLGLWAGARRFAASDETHDDGDSAGDPENGTATPAWDDEPKSPDGTGDTEGTGDPRGPDPPDRREPEPALP